MWFVPKILEDLHRGMTQDLGLPESEIMELLQV